jgi:HTH-type transcriptional regulator/antitoxin HigA
MDAAQKVVHHNWHPYVPANIPSPGYTLRETLDALGMSQSKLASRTGLTLKHINQIIQGNAAISPSTAVALERATGVPAQFWNNLESQYQDHKVRTEEADALAASASEWLNKMPVADLRKRGYISASKREPGRLLQELLSFFGVATISAWETSWDRPAAAFLQSSAYTIDPAAVAAWLRLGEIEAQKMEHEPFDRAKLKALLPELRAMTVQDPDDFYPGLVAKLAQVGVCLVLVPDIAGTRASGATRFLSPTRAVIQLSNRGKRNDKFWFALFHEIGHLLLHSKKETFLRFDEIEARGASARVEDEANDFAGKFLIPVSAEPDLLAIKTPADATALAARLGIAPAIVAGRYQRETQKWSFGTKLFHKYEIVTTAEES